MCEEGPALYYMASIRNAASIALRGSLSRNQVETSDEVQAEDIADPIVIKIRDKIQIEGRPLNDY